MTRRRRRTARPPSVPPTALTFPTPTSADNPDAAVNVGVRFTVTGPGLWVGNRILYTTSAWSTAPKTTAYDDAGLVLAQKDMPAWAAAGETDVMFAAAVPVVAATTYQAAYGPVDRYAYHTSGVYPIVGPIAVGDVNDGRFKYNAGVVHPDTATGLCFYVSPLVVF